MKTIIVISLLVVFLGSINTMLAQNILIKGKVIDKKSNMPLGYATVSIKNEGVGTVANADGEFEFYILGEHLEDTLIVSMLGYHPFEKIVKTLDQNSALTLSLKESVITLNEIIVIGDTLSANGIFQKAYTNIGQTFSYEKFLLKGFYRQIDTEDGRYVLLVEAAIEISDEKYELNRNFKLKEKVYVRQARSSNSFFQKDIKNYFEESNTLVTLLKFNFTRYRNDYLMKRKNFTLDSVMQLNDRSVYVISSSKVGADVENCFTLYIDTRTFAIWKVVNKNTALRGHFLSNFSVPVSRDRSLILKLVAATQVYQFKDYNHKMFLSQALSQTKGQIIDVATSQFVREVTDEDILIVNEIQSGKEITVLGNRKMDESINLKFFDNDYTPEFWTNYDLVKVSPLTGKQIHDLEADIPLEKQFKMKR